MVEDYTLARNLSSVVRWLREHEFHVPSPTRDRSRPRPRSARSGLRLLEHAGARKRCTRRAFDRFRCRRRLARDPPRGPGPAPRRCAPRGVVQNRPGLAPWATADKGREAALAQLVRTRTALRDVAHAVAHDDIP